MAWSFLPTGTPFGMAHRGGDRAAPENTRAAFAHAVSLGYDHLETDVHLSADGVLVAFHDVDLQRLAGVDGHIADRTWDEIAGIELGGDHHIPRLEELLLAFPEARFNIDPKVDEAVEPLAELIERLDATGRVCIGSFSDERIARLGRRLGPDLCTSPGPRGIAKVVLAALVKPDTRFPYGCLQIPPRFKGIPLDHPWLIRRIQAMGLQVHYWTVNDESEMNRLLDAGADCLISDDVAALKAVLERRGRRPDGQSTGDGDAGPDRR